MGLSNLTGDKVEKEWIWPTIKYYFLNYWIICFVYEIKSLKSQFATLQRDILKYLVLTKTQRYSVSHAVGVNILIFKKPFVTHH